MLRIRRPHPQWYIVPESVSVHAPLSVSLRLVTVGVGTFTGTTTVTALRHPSSPTLHPRVNDNQRRFHAVSATAPLWKAANPKAAAAKTRKRTAAGEVKAATTTTANEDASAAPAGTASAPKGTRARKKRTKKAPAGVTSSADTAPADSEDVSLSVQTPNDEKPQPLKTTGSTETVSKEEVASENGDEVEEFMALLEKEAKAREAEEEYERTGVRPQQDQSTTTAAEAVASSTNTDSATTEDAAATAGEERLSPDQLRAIRAAVDEGRNVFITGGAGTGKSLVVREIVRRLRLRYPRGNSSVYVTATTGVAALNVRGSTIYSFAGILLGKGTPEEVLRVVRRNRKACIRWKYCRALIIDEVSMLEVGLLEKLDYVARSIRKSDVVFGGIQVILCGDFLQLPPVVNARGSAMGAAGSGGGGAFGGSVFASDFPPSGLGTPTDSNGAPARYAFQTQGWKDLDLTTVVLKQKHRQSADVSFQTVLEDMRMGVVSAEGYKTLMQRSVDVSPANMTEALGYPAAPPANPFEEALAAQGTTPTEPAAAPPPSSTEELAAHVKAKAEEASRNADHFYVRLFATNEEVDSLNMRHFSTLVPYTSPSRPTQALSSPSLTQHEVGANSEAETHRGHKPDDPLRPLAVFTAEDYTIEPVPGKPRQMNRTRIDTAAFVEKQQQEQQKFHSFGRANPFGQRGGRGAGAAAKYQPPPGGVRFEDSALPTTLPLKVGTRVMLLKNISTSLGLVNGSVGEVTGFLHPLEMVQLAMMAPHERRRGSSRGGASTHRDGSSRDPGTLSVFELLCERGGFASADDVMRCVDTFSGRSLAGVLRGADLDDPSTITYEDVYGQRHWESLLALTHSEALWRDDSPASQAAAATRAAAAAAHAEDEELLSTLVARDGAEQQQRRGASFSEAPVVRVGEGLLTPASAVTLSSLTPERRRAGRLPLVKIDLTVAPLSALEERMAEADRVAVDGRPQRRWRPPSHVYAFVSPHTQEWFRQTQVMATRSQLPLRHAWAITVHKSQGLTIPRLDIDMQRFFSDGQAYVALSRATALDRVRLRHFNVQGIHADPIATQFYRQLESGESSAVSDGGMERVNGDDDDGDGSPNELLGLLDSL